MALLNNEVKESAYQLLLDTITLLSNETGGQFIARDIATLMRRRFPNKLREINSVINPARFGAGPMTEEERAKLAEENEKKTYVYKKPKAGPTYTKREPLKKVVAEEVKQSVNPDTVDGEEEDFYGEEEINVGEPLEIDVTTEPAEEQEEELTDEDILGMFDDDLKKLKKYLKGQNVKVANNWTSAKACNAFRELTK